MKIVVDETEADNGYFKDGTKKDKIDEDIIGKLKEKFSKELFTNPMIKKKDQQACENFVKKIDFMYKMKSGTLHPLVDRPSFNKVYSSYAASNKAQEEVEAINEFIIVRMVSSISMISVRLLCFSSS